MIESGKKQPTQQIATGFYTGIKSQASIKPLKTRLGCTRELGLSKEKSENDSLTTKPCESSFDLRPTANFYDGSTGKRCWRIASLFCCLCR